MADREQHKSAAPTTAGWQRNLVACSIAMLFSGMGLSQIAPVLPLFIRSLGVEDMGMVTLLSGVAFGINFLVSACVAPLWGVASDRYGRKPMLLRAAAGMAVLTLAVGFAPNVTVLIVLRALLGAVSGITPAATTLIATQTPKQRIGFALGVLTTARTSGQLIGPTVGGIIEMLFGFRPVFWITGSLLVVAFAVSWFFVHEEFEKPHIPYNWSAAVTLAHSARTQGLPTGARGWLARQSMRVKQPGVWQQVPHRKLILLLMLSNAINCVAIFSAQPVLTIYITQMPVNTYIGSPTLTSGLVFSASGLASIVASPILGNLCDKRGPHKVLFVCLIFATVIYFAQSHVDAAWQLLVLNFVFGLINGGLNPSIQTMIAKATPPELSGRIFGYQQAARNVGTALGSYMGGQTGAIFGIRSIYYITAALLALNAVLVYVFIWRRLRKN